MAFITVVGFSGVVSHFPILGEWTAQARSELSEALDELDNRIKENRGSHERLREQNPESPDFAGEPVYSFDDAARTADRVLRSQPTPLSLGTCTRTMPNGECVAIFHECVLIETRVRA